MLTGNGQNFNLFFQIKQDKIRKSKEHSKKGKKEVLCLHKKMIII